MNYGRENVIKLLYKTMIFFLLANLVYVSLNAHMTHVIYCFEYKCNALVRNIYIYRSYHCTISNHIFVHNCFNEKKKMQKFYSIKDYFSNIKLRNKIFSLRCEQQHLVKDQIAFEITKTISLFCREA